MWIHRLCDWSTENDGWVEEGVGLNRGESYGEDFGLCAKGMENRDLKVIWQGFFFPKAYPVCVAQCRETYVAQVRYNSLMAEVK